MARVRRRRRRKPYNEMVVGEGKDRQTLVMVPKRDFVEDRRGLLGRLFGRFRSDMKNKTSLSDDESTTDSSQEMGGSFGGSASSSRWERILRTVQIEETRAARYRDYERIDSESPEAERALNIMVKNAFQPMEDSDEAWTLKTASSSVEKIISELDRRVQMQKIAPGVARNFGLYGDGFEEIIYDESDTIVRIKWSNPNRTRRNEDEFGRLDAERAFFYTDEAGNEVVTIPAFAMVHIRFRHKRGNLYGTSFDHGARKPWRQLDASENGVLMDRLTRATDRIVHHIPIPAGTSPTDEETIVQNQMDRFRRTSIVDEDGNIDLTNSPLADDEDIFVATYPDNPAKIERLMANSMTGEITDVKYFRTKFLGAFGVPPAFMGVEEDINAKATLNEQAIEFGRDVRAFQKTTAEDFMREVYDRQLLLRGVIPESGLYEIVFPPLGFVDEMIRWQVARLQWEIVAIGRGMGVPMDWLLRNVLMLGDEDVTVIMGGLDVQPSPAESAGLESLRSRAMENVHLRRSVEDLSSMIVAARRAKLTTSVSF